VKKGRKVREEKRSEENSGNSAYPIRVFASETRDWCAHLRPKE